MNDDFNCADFLIHEISTYFSYINVSRDVNYSQPLKFSKVAIKQYIPSMVKDNTSVTIIYLEVACSVSGS